MKIMAINGSPRKNWNTDCFSRILHMEQRNPPFLKEDSYRIYLYFGRYRNG